MECYLFKLKCFLPLTHKNFVKFLYNRHKGKNMNKFLVFPCIKQDIDNGYSGPVVMLACASNISFVLFFPISEENASMLNYVLENPPEKQNINIGSTLGVYKAMLDAWSAGDRFLSGILLDTEYDMESKQEVISARLVISNEGGPVDSIVKVNFVHAILLAAMDRKEILVTKYLLSKLVPIHGKNSEEDEEDDGGDGSVQSKSPKRSNKEESLDPKAFPIDKEILDLAKKIMSGKIK